MPLCTQPALPGGSASTLDPAGAGNARSELWLPGKEARSKKQGLPPKSHSNLMPWRGLSSAKDPQEQAEGEPIPAPGRTRI